ncbi:hypothetical protein QS257_04415 [Terrilactibacillus sp. S3-3]|nr:hypothetical protein QS257_04415 [Terrilactibacillus sp. S3-3]
MDKYNSEGYPDPTAAEALENVMREEKEKKNISVAFSSAHPLLEIQLETWRMPEDT